MFKSVTGNCSNYTVVVRFRRDAIHKVVGGFQDWMLCIGYDWNNGGKGLAIGFNGTSMTNRYFSIMAGRQSFNRDVNRWRSTTETNSWTDVAVDGWKLKAWYMQEGDNQLRSAENTFTYNSTTLSQFAVQPGWQVQLGSEQDATAANSLMYCITNGVTQSSQNSYKCWSGSIQQLAFWTRTLTDAEVRQALGGTAPVEMQVGLANGASTEFRSEMCVTLKVIVELKAVCVKHPVFAAQCRTYLRMLNLPVGLVLNFGFPTLKEGLEHVFNPKAQSPDLQTSETPSSESNSDDHQRQQAPGERADTPGTIARSYLRSL